MPPRLPSRLAVSPIDSINSFYRNAYRPTQCANAFSTTPRHQLPLPQRKTPGNPQAKKGVKSLHLKKSARSAPSNPPAPGERKAFKNRIVLCNTNAREVSGLMELSAENLLDDHIRGKVMAIPKHVTDALLALGAFKRGQGWANFRTPACLVTEDLYNLSQIMEDITKQAKAGNNDPETSVRRVLSGAAKTGKSAFILQALTMALLKNWVVINIPESREWTDATTNYAPIKDTEPTQYMQMDATAEWLKTIADANQNILKKMTISKSYPNLGITSGKNLSLYQLVQQGISNPDIAWPVFSALWAELTLPNTPEIEKLGYRPPILYSADNISHLFGASEYQSLQGETLQPIHALDLAVPRHFIDHITGTKKLPNGGVVLGATSKSDVVYCPPLEVGVEMAESRSASPDVAVQLDEYWNPLQSIDQRMMDMCLDLDVLTLKGVSKTEAKTLIEYWAYNGLVRQRIADSFVGEQWTISGGGILGELERTVIKMRF